VTAARAGGKGAEGLGDIGGAYAAYEGQDEVTADGDGLRSSTCANLGVVFPESHVAHIVRSVLDGPVGADEGEHVGGVGVLWGETGDPKGHLVADFTRARDDTTPFPGAAT